MVQAWSQIRNHYAVVAELRPSLKAMLNLVVEIEASRYATWLFAWTSMQDLCIAQTPVSYPYHGPYLRISPREGDQLEFRYVDSAITEKQWSRITAGKDGFTRLESFIDQLRWFT